MMFRRFATAAIFLVSGTALASAQQITGVVGIDGGLDFHHSEGRYLDDSYLWDEDGTGYWGHVFGKLGVVVSDDISLQFDAWFRSGTGVVDGVTSTDGGATYDPYDEPYNWSQRHYGAIGHVTFHSGDFLYGLAGGLGGFSGDGTEGPLSVFGTAAVEGG